MVIDAHAHLDDRRFSADRAAVIARAQAAGVERIITVGADVASSEAAVAIAQENPGVVFATAGIHPHEARLADAPALARLRAVAQDARVVAVGETGLDYHYDHSPRDAQQAAFEAQVRLALELDLPLVIHCREAFDDCFAILERRRAGGLRGVAHCFSGGWEEAQRFLALGFDLSFSGVLTYASAAGLRDVAPRAPMDRVMVETDCPYLTPRAHGRARNEPAFVVDVAQALAQARGMDAAEAGAITARNTARLFGLPATAAGLIGKNTCN